jgi:hypothetical protein
MKVPNIPSAKSHTHFSVLGSCQRIRPGPRLFIMIRNKLEVLRLGAVSPPIQPPNWRITPCPRLLIRYIRSHPPYLEAVCFIRNLRTRHAAVTGDSLNTGYEMTQYKICVAVSKTPRLRKNCSWHKKCVLFFSTTFVRHIFSAPTHIQLIKKKCA